MDPTIPTTATEVGGQVKRSYPTWGWFEEVRESGEIVLQGHGGPRWPLSRCSIMGGTWGNDKEGMSKLPRPRVFDPDGEILCMGDNVRIDFMDGDPTVPVVQGGWRQLAPVDFLPYNHNSPTNSRNRLAGRLRPLDDQGVGTGLTEWELCHDDDASLRLTLKSGEEETGAVTFVSLTDKAAADGGPGLEVRTSKGVTAKFNNDGVTIQNKEGDIFQMDGANKKITLQRVDGSAVIQLADGKVVVMSSSTIELASQSVTFGDGSAAPTNRLPLELLISGLVTNLGLVNDAIGGVPSVPVTTFVTAVNLALAGPGAPYVSQSTKVGK